MRAFEPDEPNHKKIEDAERDKTNRVREGETIELVGNKDSKDDYGQEICPQPSLEQRQYQREFDGAVAE